MRYFLVIIALLSLGLVGQKAVEELYVSGGAGDVGVTITDGNIVADGTLSLAGGELTVDADGNLETTGSVVAGEIDFDLGGEVVATGTVADSTTKWDGTAWVENLALKTNDSRLALKQDATKTYGAGFRYLELGDYDGIMGTDSSLGGLYLYQNITYTGTAWIHTATGAGAVLNLTPTSYRLRTGTGTAGATGTLNTIFEFDGTTYTYNSAMDFNSTIAAEDITSAGTVNVGALQFNSYSTVAISGDSLTLPADKSRIYLVSEGYTGSGVVSDQLDTITPTTDGFVILLRNRYSSSTMTTTIKDGTGNISLSGATDFALTNARASVTLYYDTIGAVWREISRCNP